MFKILLSNNENNVEKVTKEIIRYISQELKWDYDAILNWFVELLDEEENENLLRLEELAQQEEEYQKQLAETKEAINKALEDNDFERAIKLGEQFVKKEKEKEKQQQQKRKVTSFDFTNLDDFYNFFKM